MFLEHIVNLRHLQFQLEVLKLIENEIESIVKDLNTPIFTIPGIGYVTGAVILAELGDINKFSSDKKIVAYAGLDATVNQSGQSDGQHGHLSKRGSTHLRKALFQAAFVASTTPSLKIFMTKNARRESII